MNVEARALNVGPRRATRSMLGVALAFGAMHVAVDAASVAVFTREGSTAVLGDGEAAWYQPGASWWGLYLLYAASAFGMQFPIGALVDRWQIYRGAVLGAVGLLAAGVTIGHAAPVVAVVLAGLGNAFFHVGAGAIVLRLAPHRASAAGVFVGPGTIGLALGVWLPRAYPDLCSGISLGLLAATTAIALSVGWISGAFQLSLDESPSPSYEADRSTPGPLPIGAHLAVLCLVALLVSIGLRATAGLAVGQVHQGEQSVFWGLAIAACAGKMSGGFIADRFGWLLTSVATLLLSMPLLSLLVDSGISAVAGMVLFQMTMPVALTAVYRIFPREPGLAFGLASLALLVGAAFMLFLPDLLPRLHLALFVIILLSVPAVVVGLRPFQPRAHAPRGHA